MTDSNNDHTKGEILIRPYRDSDFDNVIELFLIHMYEDDAPASQILKSQYIAPLSFLSYSLVITGLIASYLLSSSTFTKRIAALAFPVVGILIFSYHRYSLYIDNEKFLQSCLTGDLADIGKHYGMNSKSQNGRPRRSGFWVAEEQRKNAYGNIVGFIGLDASTTPDLSTAEIRRMTVSANHRRRGIAQKLIQAVFEHARESGVKSIFLGTTAYNLSAIIMYKKVGFVVENIEDIPIRFQAPIKRYIFRLDL